MLRLLRTSYTKGECDAERDFRRGVWRLGMCGVVLAGGKAERASCGN
jgi:hypothetical protein